MRAVVTGCAGFIGSHLTERLLRGGWNVTGIDSFSDYYDVSDKESNLAAVLGQPGFELIRGDVSTLSMGELLADRPVVFHLAAQPGVRGSFGSSFDVYVRDNIVATQRLFEASLAAGVPRVVYASSSSVYGDAETYPTVEATTPLRPRSPYGVTKATCENLAAVYRNLGLMGVGLRYFTVYGPRQRPDMAMRKLCDSALAGTPFTLFGDGSQSRDFTHVSDVVDATIRAAEMDPISPVFNVGGGHEASMTEVIRLIEQLAGCPLTIETSSVQRGDVKRTGADTTAARRELGWVPKVGLAEGLASELAWVRDRAAATLSPKG